LIDKFFQLLYDTIFISITKTSEQIEIYTEVYFKKTLKASETKLFTLNQSFKKELLLGYIEELMQDSPYAYITLLDDSSTQGAIITCEHSKMKLFTQVENAKTLCVDENRWGVYTDVVTLYEQEKSLEPLFVDFIFSPFILLYEFYKDKIQTQSLGMYLLVLEEGIALSIFRDRDLLFAEYINTQKEEEELALESTIDAEDALLEEEMIDSIDLEDIDIDESLDELDDLSSSLEDLDSLESIEELDALDAFDDPATLEEQLEENLEEIEEFGEHEEENFSEEDTLKRQEQSTQDYYRFTLIQTALKRYYEDDLYESDFIEQIYVADTISLSKDFKRYIQEELFANVIIRKMELSLELNALARKELGL